MYDMVGRGKLKQACSSKGLSGRLEEEDRLSQLPNGLICQILSHLPIKEAVKTSVLSPRWKNLWLWVSRLELDYWDFGNIDTFMSFGGRFFDSNRVLDNLKLNLLENYMGVDVVSSITSWIDASLKHKVQHLHVRFPYEMPLSLYTCKTLVSLILCRVALPNAEFVSLPRLKTMHLIAAVWDPDKATFERLVSSCPVLEELEVRGRVNFDEKVYRVHSRSLKRLNIVRDSTIRVDYVPGVVIDAPQLCCLRIIDDVSKSFIVNNLDFIAKLEISLTFGLEMEGLSEASVSSGRSHIRSFLAGISSVRDMTVCAYTFKVLHYYSISALLPQFGYMSRLCVTLHAPPNFIWLATFLESCPNLKSLVLASYYYRGQSSDNQIVFSHVPECLLSSLECVDFQFTFSGLVVEMKLARYFLENSAVLKKLTLHVDSRSKENFKTISEIPRASTKCEVVIVKGNMCGWN